jgi:uncharacterized RDD family membrane protein YckC
MTEWYYADRQRQQHGPVAGQTLAQLFRAGTIDATSLVWRDGLEQWQPLSSLRAELALDPAVAEPAVTPPPAGGSEDEGVTLDLRHAVAVPAEPASQGSAGYSPYAAPSAAATASDAPVLGGEVVLAGFWKRVAAYVIDSLVVGVAGGMIAMVLGMLLVPLSMIRGASEDFSPTVTSFVVQIFIQLVSLAIAAAYFGYFHSSRSQASLGKMAVGIKVVRTDGSRITLARGVGRYFAGILSGLTLCIGYLMAAFTERKQGLHDILCDTLVVDKWAYTEHPEWQRHELGTVALVVLIIYGLLLLLVGVVAIVAVGAVMTLLSGGWN